MTKQPRTADAAASSPSVLSREVVQSSAGAEGEALDQMLDDARSSYLSLRYRGPAPQWDTARGHTARRDTTQWQASTVRPPRWLMLATACATLAVLVGSAVMWRKLGGSSGPEGADGVRVAAAAGDLERPAGSDVPAWPGGTQRGIASPSGSAEPGRPELGRPEPAEGADFTRLPAATGGDRASSSLHRSSAGRQSPPIERLDGVGLGTLEVLRREVDRLDSGTRSRPPRFTGMSLRLPSAPSRWSPGPPPTRGVAGD